MLLQIFYLVGQQERIGHEAIIDWKKALQATYYDAEDVLLCEVVHQWIPIDQCAFHFNQLYVAISQCESVIENVTIRLIARLSIAILANHVLDCVHLVPAVVSVHNDVAPASVRRLDNAHDLGRTLRRCGLLSALLLSTLIFLVFRSLAVILIELLLLPLLL